MSRPEQGGLASLLARRRRCRHRRLQTPANARRHLAHPSAFSTSPSRQTAAMDVRTQVTGDLIGRDTGEVGTGEHPHARPTTSWILPSDASRLCGDRCAALYRSLTVHFLLPCLHAAVDHILRAPDAACEGLVRALGVPPRLRRPRTGPRMSGAPSDPSRTPTGCSLWVRSGWWARARTTATPTASTSSRQASRALPLFGCLARWLNWRTAQARLPTASACRLLRPCCAHPRPWHLMQGTPIVPHEVEPHQRFTEVGKGRARGKGRGQQGRRATGSCSCVWQEEPASALS